MAMKLYTTHCPKCTVLEKKLNAKNIKFEICEDISVMQDKGFTSLPILEVDGKELNFPDAVKYVNAL